MKGPGDTLLEVKRKDQLERVAKHFKWKQEGKKEQEIFSKKLDFFFLFLHLIRAHWVSCIKKKKKNGREKKEGRKTSISQILADRLPSTQFPSFLPHNPLCLTRDLMVLGKQTPTPALGLDHIAYFTPWLQRLVLRWAGYSCNLN